MTWENVIQLLGIIISSALAYNLKETFRKSNLRKNYLQHIIVRLKALLFILEQADDNDKMFDFLDSDFDFIKEFEKRCVKDFAFKNILLQENIYFITHFIRAWINKITKEPNKRQIVIALINDFVSYFDLALKHKVFFFFNTNNFDYKYNGESILEIKKYFKKIIGENL